MFGKPALDVNTSVTFYRINSIKHTKARHYKKKTAIARNVDLLLNLYF